MKILITGSRGQLGTELSKHLKDGGHDVVATDRDTLDMRWAPGQIEAAIASAAPDWIINCAALTNVDGCEAQPDLARQLNCDGAAALAAAASRHSARILQVSTDYVFSGEQGRPYREDDPTGPLNVYGETKLAGEKAVLHEAPDALVVRTSWIYGGYGRNFVKTMLRAAGGTEALRVVDDQLGTPTSTATLAAALTYLAEHDASGIYHFSNAGACSWYDFAQAIVDEAHAVGLIDNAIVVKPVSSTEFPRPASRPSNSVLSKEKVRGILDHPIPHWRESLNKVLQALASSR